MTPLASIEKKVVDVGIPETVGEVDAILRENPNATHVRLFGFTFPIV